MKIIMLMFFCLSGLLAQTDSLTSIVMHWNDAENQKENPLVEKQLMNGMAAELQVLTVYSQTISANP